MLLVLTGRIFEIWQSLDDAYIRKKQSCTRQMPLHCMQHMHVTAAHPLLPKLLINWGNRQQIYLSAQKVFSN